MIRRVDLLPARYAEQRRQRRALALVIGAGVVVLLLLGAYYFSLQGQIRAAEDELASIQARNAELQVQIDALARFAQLEAEVVAKEAALATVMQGDVDWPAILTELAMVTPGEVWLTNLTASAGVTEGATTVPTEANPIRLTPHEPFGRISFTGNALSMPGVAKWLLRLGTVKEFQAIFLGNATGTVDTGGFPEDAAAEVAETLVTFTSTLELSDKAASGRFQEPAP